MRIKECLNCKNKYETNTRSLWCSENCKTDHQKEIRKQKDFIKNNKKYENLIEEQDYVICKECGIKGKNLQFHILIVHKISIKEYKEKYNNDIVCKKLLKIQSERIKGENNPGYNHGGKFSPFSNIFVGTSSKEEVITKMKKTKKSNPQNENTKIDYYTSKGYTEEESKIILSKRQSTFSLEKCIKKYGEEIGKKKWLERQEKWHKNFKKSNFSKISQELFWVITEKLENLEHIYFAQLSENKQKDISGINNEYKLKLEKLILPDFLDLKQKKIIEFDGVYWHGEIGKGNKEREKQRDNILLNNGFKVLRIDENEFKNNKQGTIEKCINFLTQ